MKRLTKSSQAAAKLKRCRNLPGRRSIFSARRVDPMVAHIRLARQRTGGSNEGHPPLLTELSMKILGVFVTPLHPLTDF